MERELISGIRGENQIVVDKSVSATTCASGEMEVYATPMMIALLEQTADESVRPYLKAGQATVGTKVEVAHLSATPMGMRVRAESELIEVDGRRLVFSVAAFDEAGKIGEGRHERFIIDKKRFMEKAQSKFEK